MSLAGCLFMVAALLFAAGILLLTSGSNDLNERLIALSGAVVVLAITRVVLVLLARRTDRAEP